ncbi:transporter substrate-binding domain-containing protein [Aminipila terrae]|uniref:Transporter substrate-binding domain-containing protein n=1 Tax=Aminipila terrae TaxID=2697030 RepID=A0A6P1MC84_9FIRM|nr:transporter substrate-binding domain-containing protein [Aminipila terrae]QHI71517.1 transporter substrate-binding domain-containing protein [Aminipila terrae]
MYRFSLFRKILCFAALIILIVSTLSPSYADEVKKSPIKVGFFELDGFNDVDQDGNLSGYGYEYLMEISKYTGWKYNFIYYTEDKNGKHRLTYYEALDLLKQGKIDIMGSMRKTPERSDLYLYPIFPYNINYSCLSAASDNTKYTCSDFSSLDGVVIGTFRGSSRDDEIKAFLKENGVKNYSLKAYDTMKQLKKALLKTHTIDLIYANNFRSIENERVLVRLNPSPYYFAMSKNNRENLDALSSAVEQIEVNRPLFSKKLLTKYFQDSYSSQLKLSPEELQYIKSNPVVRVAYDPYFAPFEYYDKSSGRVCGISADLLRLISKQTGLKFSYAPTTSYDSALKNAKKNHIQLIATFGSDYKWAEKHHSRLTTSYLDLPVSAIYNKKVKNYNDKSLSVAVEKGYFLTEKLKREKLYTHYIYYDTLEECINAVDKGDADITFASTYSADYFLSHSYYSNLKMFTTYDLNYEISLAVTNTSDDLLYSIINKSLANIPRRSFDDIFYKNILFYKENASLSDYITLHPYEFMAAGSILGALLLAGLVSLRTAKHNAKQEKYLNDERINLALMHTNISLWDYDFKNKLLIQPSGSKKYLVRTS